MFQAKVCDEAGLFEVFEMINERAAKPLTAADLQEGFELRWPRIKEALKYTPPARASAAPARNEREILDEILLGIRQLLRERRSSPETGHASFRKPAAAFPAT